MKLNAVQIGRVEEQLGVQAVPEENPVTDKLKEAFGDHTFFFDTAGLHVVEPAPSPEGLSGNVVKLATWADEGRTELLTHEPEVQAVTIDLAADESDPAT